MTVEQNLEKVSPRTPFLLRVLSLTILAEGILGLLFFVLAGLFQMNADNFAGVMELKGMNRYFYSFYIIIHIIIFSGMLASGILLLKMRKLGFYLFIISYLTISTITIYVNNTFGWAAVVVGLSFFVVLAYFYKKMK